MKLRLLTRRSTGNGSAKQTGAGIVTLSEGGSLADVADEIARHDLQYLILQDETLFREEADTISLCREMRACEINVLWSARCDSVPTRNQLHAMRLVGCQHLELCLDSEEAEQAFDRAREFGFDMTLRHPDGRSYAVDVADYTVSEREAVCAIFPDLHTAQFDLAVAYFKARRYREVMLPLAKSMTLGFPVNELCLNLLACLSAAKHYPEMAAGLLKQARYGNCHPVVDKNADTLRSWVRSGGDVQGVRLQLEPARASLAMARHQA